VGVTVGVGVSEGVGVLVTVAIEVGKLVAVAEGTESVARDTGVDVTASSSV